MSDDEEFPVQKAGPLSWRPTKIMNMHDLSKDDDFLSHLLVEKLGRGCAPLLVHKMDSSRQLPKTDAQELLRIVQRLVNARTSLHQTMRQAVEELLRMGPVRYYLMNYTQRKINAFATHASRYFELYHPSGSIEIAHTSRYSHRTGKSELCILATRQLSPGSVITELKGSMANLSEDEDRELKRTGHDIRRDFSVIHSKSMKKNHLFLGPARFVNHDCENNCELFREGRYITFRVLRPIAIGEEITAHYGNGYFGKRNRHCLCATCERKGRGGYAPENSDEESPSSSSDSNSDSDTSDSDIFESDVEESPVNLNERRTRRGVYAVNCKGKQTDAEATTLLVASASGTPSSRFLSTEQFDLSQSSTPSTSRPKPRAAGLSVQVVTPPLTEESASVTEEPLVTESTSASTRVSARLKGKARTTFIAPSRQKAVEIKVKLEHVETPLELPRRKRGRPSLASKNAELAAKTVAAKSTTRKPTAPPQEPAPARPSVPLGPDGRPLPVCNTCHSVIPVISLDSHVMGSSTPGTPKRNKVEECPRCARHCAIYGQPWPRRIPLPGSLPTPREDSLSASPSKRVSKKSLSIIDKKLAAAASASASLPARTSQRGTDEPPTKKRKLESASAPVKPAAAAPPPPPPPPEVPVKRKRGRPRLTEIAARKAAEAARIAYEAYLQGVKLEEVEVPLPTSPAKVTTSPRVKFSRAERAEERDKVRDQTEVLIVRIPKRRLAVEVEPIARKKAKEDEELGPPEKVLPKPSNFRTGIMKAAPVSFAIRAWGDALSPKKNRPVLELTETTETETQKSEVVLSLPIAALTAGPSPFNFARRRWSSFNDDEGTLFKHIHRRVSLSDLSRDTPDSDLPEGEQYIPPVLDLEVSYTTTSETTFNTPLPSPGPSLFRAGWESDTSDP